MIDVEILYFDGCPTCQRVQEDLAVIVAELDLDTRLRFVEVVTAAQADALNFAGSPTVKVDGRDLEDYDGPGVFACRLYGDKGWPSRELLADRLLSARRSSITGR